MVMLYFEFLAVYCEHTDFHHLLQLCDFWDESMRGTSCRWAVSSKTCFFVSCVLALYAFFFFFFLTGAVSKGLILREKTTTLCIFSVHLRQDWFCWFLIIWGLMTCVLGKQKKTNKKGDRLKIVLSPDVIICGWLGSKYQLTNF